jgi:hypothetical protein
LHGETSSREPTSVLLPHVLGGAGFSPRGASAPFPPASGTLN